MRNATCVALLLAASSCGIQNKVAPDGAEVDGLVAGDDSGSGSSAELTITLTDKPAVLGNVAAATFGFSTSIPATTECRVDGDDYAACTSPDTVPALADGMHSFDARATADDQHAAIPTYSFTVDTVAPAMMITGQPAMTSPVATAQFHFTTDDALAPSVMCQLDAQAAVACTSPVSYAGLADGSHTFTLTGSDGAGNLTTKTYTWTVDTAAPSLTITAEPPDPYSSKSAHFEFTIGTSATVSCQLDSAAATACTSPIDYSGLAEGAHTFTLRGTNVGGMTTTAAYTWHVDTVAPAVMITSGPAPDTNSTTAQLVFTVTGATTVTCQLDSGTPAACTSPWTYNSLADGAHVFTLKAVDTAGNSTTATKNWTVDTDPPVVTLTSTPGNPSTSKSAAFAFTVTGAATTTCKIDSASATSCTGSASYSALAEGNHTFTVTATDAASNVSTKSYMWLVDTIAPLVSISSAPPADWHTSMAHFGFSTGGDAISVTCQLDMQAPAPCIASIDYSNVADGPHTFTVRVVDAAGNSASSSANWTVDTVAPTVVITSNPAATSNDSSPSFTFTTSGATAVTCQLDNAPAAPCTTSAGYSGVADGSHTFTVSASDAAGNVDNARVFWDIDTVPPVVSIGNKPPANTNNTTASFTFSVTGAQSATCQLSPGAAFDCTGLSSYSQSSLADGTHTFSVTGTDAAGNVGSASYAFNVDTVAPLVAITGKPAVKSTSHTATFSFSVTDGSPVCAFGLNPGTSCTSPATYTLADGDYIFSVSTTDAAGNFGIASYSFGIDATLPSASVNFQCDPSSITWIWSGSDANLSSCTCSGTGIAAFNCTTPGQATYPNLTDKSFSMTCTDTYGNSRTASKTLTATQINACGL